MTYTTPVFSTLNAEGVDLSTAFTLSTSTPEYPGAPFSIGTEVIGSGDGRWVYATASGAITAGDVCVITKVFSALPVTSAIAATCFGLRLATSQVTVTTGQYSWYQYSGTDTTPGVNVTASIAQNVQLYTTATAGRLGAIATGSSVTAVGIVTTTTSASTAGAYPGVMVGAYVGAAN
jgi:hypothetical protein